LAIPGTAWCSATQNRWYPRLSARTARSIVAERAAPWSSPARVRERSSRERGRGSGGAGGVTPSMLAAHLVDRTVELPGYPARRRRRDVQVDDGGAIVLQSDVATHGRPSHLGSPICHSTPLPCESFSAP